jgi:PAS domain S-box-containing protein
MDDRGRRGTHVSARGDPGDWADTPLGPPDQWSAHLHAAVGMCLDLALPAALYWGQELTVVCNDGFRQLLGIREPALEFLAERSSPAPPRDYAAPTTPALAESWMRQAAAFHGDSFERSLSHVLATGLPIRATMQPHGLTDGNGGPRFLEISLSPVREADGHVAGVLQIVQDVTAHVPASAAGADVARAEQAIADSHTLLWAVIEGTSDAVWVKDREGRYLLFNSAAAAIVGKTADEVLGHDDRAVLPPDVAQQVMARDRKILSVGHTVTYEETIPLPAGHRVFSTMKTAWRDAQGHILGTLGVSRDITDAKEAEAALKRQSRLVEAMFNQAVSPFTLMDCDARFIRVNEAFAKYYGKSVDEFAGRLYWDVLPFDRTPENEAQLANVIESRKAFRASSAPYLFADRTPPELAYFDIILQPILDEHGKVEVLFFSSIDVTERTRAEARLRTSLAEKEVLLKEVHHRVKNNLQFVSSLLALQSAKFKDPKLASAIKESQQRVRAMALMHEQLYRGPNLASIPIARHITALCADLCRSYSVDPDRIALDLRVADMPLDLDRAIRCGLIVNELVSNAIQHAFPAGRRGRVTVRLDAIDGYYELAVSDDGVGLPAGLDPLHTPSLGLQLVADLADQLGGALSVDRNGQTSFTIRFPAENGDARS